MLDCYLTLFKKCINKTFESGKGYLLHQDKNTVKADKWKYFVT